MTELLPCPFCGQKPTTKGYELTGPGKLGYWVTACPASLSHSASTDSWTSAEDSEAKWNTRAPIPATPSHDRMADVRLGAFTALCEERHVVRSAYVYQKEYEVDELEVRRDAARIAATVTLPAIQKNERSTDAFQCPSCGAAIKAPPRSNEKTLRRYGWHDESCPDYPTRTRPIGLCNCGFLSALAQKEGK